MKCRLYMYITSILRTLMNLLKLLTWKMLIKCQTCYGTFVYGCKGLSWKVILCESEMGDSGFLM